MSKEAKADPVATIRAINAYDGAEVALDRNTGATVFLQGLATDRSVRWQHRWSEWEGSRLSKDGRWIAVIGTLLAPGAPLPRLVVHSANHQLVLISRDGDIRWKADVQSAAPFSFRFAESQIAVMGQERSGLAVQRFELEDGVLLGQTTLQEANVRWYGFGPDVRTAIVYTQDDELHTYEPSGNLLTSSTLWAATSPLRDSESGATAAAERPGGGLLVSNHEGMLFDLGQGWQRGLPHEVVRMLPLADGSTVAVLADMSLVVLDAHGYITAHLQLGDVSVGKLTESNPSEAELELEDRTYRMSTKTGAITGIRVHGMADNRQRGPWMQGPDLTTLMPPRTLGIEQALEASVDSMIVQNGEVVVLTADGRVFRFHGGSWKRLALNRGRSFAEIKGPVLGLTLLPGPKREPWLASVLAVGEDATMMMQNMHLELYSITPQGYRPETLSKNVGLPTLNLERFAAARSGASALCSESLPEFEPFCLLGGSSGWHVRRTKDVGVLRFPQWIDGRLFGVTRDNTIVALGSDNQPEELSIVSSIATKKEITAFYGVSAGDFWTADESRWLRHGDTRYPSTVGKISTIFVDDAGTVWIGGDLGVAYLENGSFRRIAGIRSAISTIVATSPGEVWFAGAAGVYRTVTRSAEQRYSDELRTPQSPVAAPSQPISAGTSATLIGDSMTLVNPGRAPLRGALFAQRLGPDSLAFMTAEGLYTHRLRKRGVRRERDIDGNTVAMGSVAVKDVPSPCAAQTATAPGWFAALYRSNGEQQAWLTAARKPTLRTCHAGVLTHQPLFDFVVADLAQSSTGHVWLAGGSSDWQSERQQRTWPVGEGLLVDWAEGQTQTYRVTQGPLYSVSVGAETTWAAGARGLVARVQGGKLDVFQLEPHRAFWDALADSDGKGVWLVGAGREVVHFDGQTQIRYRADTIRGSLTALVRDGDGRLWIVGPETLFRASSG